MRIHCNSFVRVGFCAALLSASQANLACGQDKVSVEPVPLEDPAAADPTRSVIEAIIDHHIEPPARQQLVLEVLRGIAEATSQQLPRDLSTRISGISDIEAIYSLLNDEKERLGLNGPPNEKVEMAVQQRLNRIVPGGVQIILKKDYVVNEQLAANRYVGIGVQVNMDATSERMQFMKVMEDGPAEIAGLKAGDVVEAVDGKDTFQVPLGEIVQWLRGPEESVVKITVRSPGAEPREIEIVRRVVPLRTLNRIPQSGNAAVALIRPDRLSASTVHELRKIIFRERACIKCHDPDREFTSPQTYDVAVQDEAGTTMFNPPSLKGLGHRRAYFHDARFRTIDELLETHPDPRAAASVEEKSRLKAFLLSL